MNKELTSTKYWSKRWKKNKSTIIQNTNKNPIYLVNKLFDRFSKNRKTMIEIGCAPGAWMHYFYKEYHMKVSGIEYSKVGYEKTKMNLDMINVKGYNLIFDDFLKHDFSQTYDLVLSLGFIEHFNHPEEVIKKHLALLSEKGILIMSVPNFDKKNRSLNYLLLKTFNKKDLYYHNLSITNLEGLSSICKRLKLKIDFIGYVGGINFGVTTFESRFNKFSKAFYLFNAIFVRLLKIIGYKKENNFFSPYIFVVIEK